MLVQETFDRVYFKHVVDAIFATSDKGTALAIIDDFSKFWMSIIGTRGATGKKTVNASTMFTSLFESEEPEEHHIDDCGLDETKLDELEQGE
jgi:predicted DNA binding protein